MQRENNNNNETVIILIDLPNISGIEFLQYIGGAGRFVIKNTDAEITNGTNLFWQIIYFSPPLSFTHKRNVVSVCHVFQTIKPS